MGGLTQGADDQTCSVLSSTRLMTGDLSYSDETKFSFSYRHRSRVSKEQINVSPNTA